MTSRRARPRRVQLRRSKGWHMPRGKNLACWCRLPRPGPPDNCHAALLLELVNPE